MLHTTKSGSSLEIALSGQLLCLSNILERPTQHCIDQGDSLQSLAETHIVGQNTAFSVGTRHAHHARVHELKSVCFLNRVTHLDTLVLMRSHQR